MKKWRRFLKGSQKIQHAIYIWVVAMIKKISFRAHLTVNWSLPGFPKDISELVVEHNAFPHTVDDRVDCQERSDQPGEQILWQW